MLTRTVGLVLLGVTGYLVGLHDPSPWAAERSEAGQDPTHALNERYEYVSPEKLEGPAHEALVATRRSVWEAWFAGDEEQMRKLIPADAVTGSADRPGWETLDQNLEQAGAFAAAGGRLVALEFSDNKIQVNGDTAVIYVTFRADLATSDTQQVMAGRAVEVFFRRDGQWVNTGWLLAADQE